jgi:general stress protein 26
MYLQEMEESGTLWFATSGDSPLAEQIRDDARVIATFANPADHRFAVVRGRASLHQDAARIERLWNPGMQAWFPEGPSDPSITLVRIQGEHGDFWDAPGKAAGIVRFLGALVTGTRPDGGDRVHVALDSPTSPA